MALPTRSVVNLTPCLSILDSSFPFSSERASRIDAEGKIALKGGMGPGGFTPALKATPGTLDKLLSGPGGR
jgi:hypothetical protein